MFFSRVLNFAIILKSRKSRKLVLAKISKNKVVSFLFESDIKEVNNANMVDPDDDQNVDTELWTTSLGFALAQDR